MKNLIGKLPFGKQDAIALLKGVAITAGGAALTYLGSYLTKTDFGTWSPIIVILGSFLINAGRKAADGVKV